MTDNDEDRAYAGPSAYADVLKHYCGLTEEVANHLASLPDGSYPATDCICGTGGFRPERGAFDRKREDFENYRNDWRVPEFIAKAVRDAIKNAAPPCHNETQERAADCRGSQSDPKCGHPKAVHNKNGCTGTHYPWQGGEPPKCECVEAWSCWPHKIS